tara:strand:- start:2014 stop:4824 length:2811 start_codon:yes stop_codon:yes gene_type:complete
MSSSDPILTDEEIERLKNQKGGIEFGAGSNFISGGNLPNIDYGNIAGQIFAQQPRDLGNLGVDLNANRDALDALVDAGLVDLGSMGIMGAMPSYAGFTGSNLGLFSTAFDPNTYDSLKEDWIAAGERLVAHNQKVRPFDLTDPKFDQWTDQHYEKQTELQKDLQKARSAFIAAGGDPDGLAQAAAAAAATGIGGIANVLPQLAGAGTWNQVKVTPGTITGTFNPQGPNELIPIGKAGPTKDTTVVTSTGSKTLDNTINKVLGGDSVATADVPTIGEIGGAVGELIGGGLQEVAAGTLAATSDADKDNEGTDVVVGGDNKSGAPAGGDNTLDSSKVKTTDTPTKRQADVVVGGDNKNVNVDPKGLGRTDTTTDALKGTVAVRDMAGSVAPQVEGQVNISDAIKGGLGAISTTDGVSALNVEGSLGPDDYMTKGEIRSNEIKTLEDVKGDSSSSNRGGGNAGLFLPQSFRGIREEPGDLVDIDYLYDFDDGLDQLFAATDDEEELEKGLYVYEEGGEVAKQDAVDMVTRRPGEYGRSYFTQGEFVPTGTALGGESLTSSEIQIPKYTYERDLLPQFGGSVGQPSVGQSGIASVVSADPVGAGLGIVDQTQQRSPFYDADTLSNLFNSFSSIFGGGGGGESAATESSTVTTTPTTETIYTTEVVADPLKDYLSSLGYGTSPKSITKDDVAAFKGQEAFSLDDIAGALGTSEDVLNQIYNFEPTQATTTVTKAPGTGPTALQQYLLDQGFGTQKDITKADIAGFASSGFDMGDIASALGVTANDLQAVANYTAPTPADDAALYEFLKDLGFVGATKKVTKDDVAAAEAFLAANPQFSKDDMAAMLGITEYAQGGMTQGYYLGGPTDGMADLIPATIDGTQPAALSDGEFVIPADVVSHLGNGNSDAGAKQLYSMMDRVREERTGTTKQGPEIDPTKMMPA